ncbi:MAG: hypothetical protein P8X79_12035 [Reinekea sp.]
MLAKNWGEPMGAPAIDSGYKQILTWRCKMQTIDTRKRLTPNPPVSLINSSYSFATKAFPIQPKKPTASCGFDDSFTSVDSNLWRKS